MKKNPIVQMLAPLCCGAVALSLASVQAAPAQVKHGTDILHLSVREAVTNNDGASAKIDLRHNDQGKVTVQTLDILVQKLNMLAAGEEYVLKGKFLGSPDMVEIASITPDATGKALLRYRQVTHENGNGKTPKLGRGITQMPAQLADNLAALRLLEIDKKTTVKGTPPAADTVTYTAILSLDLSKPDKFEYLVKRDLSTDTIRASLQITANTKTAQFRLQASGLTADTDYTLALGDGSAFETSTEHTDAKGRLSVRAAIDPAADVLGLRTVELRTIPPVTTPPTNPTTVLSTTLP